MNAVNLTTSSVELDPVNGPGTLAPAVPESEGAHRRELTEVTDREKGLAAAGVILLEDAAGRKRPPPDPPDLGANTNGGES